jgi:RNA polymerase sigma-70 factor (ECF subfamily)
MTDADPFLACRERLRGVAYGLLGELGEADDVVQDVWLRWQDADREAVRNAEAFLVTATTRLAIDRLRSARARRETYVGTWLPTPLVSDADDPAETTIEAEKLELALLCALERLDPVERAVLVLRDAQLGDVEGIKRLLANDAIQYSDGGGRVIAARRPIHGAVPIAKFYATVGRTPQFPRDLFATPVTVSGAPGVRLVSRSGGPYAITAIEVADGRVQAIRNFLNPDRIAGL